MPNSRGHTNHPAASREELQRELVLLRLETFIYNTDHPGDAGTELKTLFGRDFLSNRFVLLLFGSDQRKSRSKDYVGSPLHEVEQQLLPTLCTYGNTALFPVMDLTLCVINPPLGLSDSPGGWTGAIAADLTAVMNSAGLSGKLNCAVGALTEGPNIQQMYRTAEIVRDHASWPSGPVSTWYTIPWKYLESQSESTANLAVLERRFMNYVNARQFFDAVTVLDEITHIRIWKSQASLRHIRSATFFRLESVLSACGISINPDETRTEVYAALEQVMNARTLKEVKDDMYDFFALLDDLLSQEEAKAKKARLIREFIDKNYADFNLDATMICEYFKLSEVYLSRIFREYCGIGWLDYVHNVRIQKARELLEKTDLRIDAVANEVGLSPRTMARLFKALEGIPPGAYRESVRSGME